MSAPLVLALPSKGRLMEQCSAMLAKAGLVVAKSGSARGHKGDNAGLPGILMILIGVGVGTLTALLREEYSA